MVLQLSKSFGGFEFVPYHPDQAPLFYSLISNNRIRLEDFFAGTIKDTRTLESTEIFFELMQIRMTEQTFIPFFIRDSKTKAFIGLIDVKNIDWNIPKAELGYFIDQNYEGQGIISRALGIVIEGITREYGFSKLFCRIASKNTGSRKVAINNGFELEGTLRRDYKTTKGELVDLNYYGRLF